MAVSGVGAVGGASSLTQLAQLYRQQVIGADPSAQSSAVQSAADRGASFGSAIGNSISSLEGLDRSAATKAVQAATGDLSDIHDYVIAATQAQTATELTTTVRNKALDAFNEIMRMPL
jgi:flagellar hook-basal body complex protein FliE